MSPDIYLNGVISISIINSKLEKSESGSNLPITPKKPTSPHSNSFQNTSNFGLPEPTYLNTLVSKETSNNGISFPEPELEFYQPNLVKKNHVLNFQLTNVSSCMKTVNIKENLPVSVLILHSPTSTMKSNLFKSQKVETSISTTCHVSTERMLTSPDQFNA